MAPHISGFTAIDKRPSIMSPKEDAATSFFVDCNHPVSRELTNFMFGQLEPDKKSLALVNVCPKCIITRIITAIKDVQKELANRGGIFTSRGDKKPRPVKHMALKKLWHRAKIEGYNVVEALRCIVERTNDGKKGYYKLSEEDMAMAREALEVWEQEVDKGQLWKLPGHRYYDEEGEMTEEDEANVRLMLDDLEKTVQLLMGEADIADPSPNSPSPTHQATPEASWTASLPKLHSPNQNVESMNGHTLSTPGVQDVPPSATQSYHRSILKRKNRHSPSPSPSQKSKSKRVRTEDFATICPDALVITNPYPFQQPSKLPATTQVSPGSILNIHFHREPTKENIKNKRSFFRPHPAYKPGIWASPESSEKANTSFSRVAWEELAKIVDREEHEREEENNLFEGLKVLAGVWVVRWWIKTVMLRFDGTRRSIETEKTEVRGSVEELGDES